MTWTKAAGPPTRDPTEQEAAAIDEMREVATEWAAGKLPLEEVKRLTRPKQRWLAVRFTAPQHAAFRPLMALLDTFIAAQGAYATKHGIVDPPLLMETGATVGREDGRTKLTFPVAYRNGQAVYRSERDRGPTIRPFAALNKPTEEEREWWEER